MEVRDVTSKMCGALSLCVPEKNGTRQQDERVSLLYVPLGAKRELVLIKVSEAGHPTATPVWTPGARRA